LLCCFLNPHFLYQYQATVPIPHFIKPFPAYFSIKNNNKKLILLDRKRE